MSTSDEQFHILALSGGGYKGLYTSRFIEQVEGRTGIPFGSHFDLICGTSIGGILALALATRDISAATVVEVLKLRIPGQTALDSDNNCTLNPEKSARGYGTGSTRTIVFRIRTCVFLLQCSTILMVASLLLRCEWA